MMRTQSKRHHVSVDCNNDESCRVVVWYQVIKREAAGEVLSWLSTPHRDKVEDGAVFAGAGLVCPRRFDEAQPV